MKWVYSGYSTATPSSSNLIKKYDYVYSSSTEGMAWKDLLTEYDGEAIVYDNIGNPTTYRGSSLLWNGRELVGFFTSDGGAMYLYDASGLRTTKLRNGEFYYYYYVEGKLMSESCTMYDLFYTYDSLGNLSGIKKVNADGTTESFGVQCNIFGDVIAIFYDDGLLAAKYTYDSWGKLLSITDMTGNDISDLNDIWTQNSIRYRGYVYDNETGWYYLQSRYYDPEICRFINADDYSVLGETPTGITGKNLFSYCDCNPINRVDSSGEFWGIIIGGVIGAISGGISSHFAEDEMVWTGVVSGLITGVMSGLLVDATVVTGGTFAFVTATFGSGFISALNSALIDVFNGHDANITEYAVDFVIGSIFGALDYGVSFDPEKVFNGTLWNRLKQDFVNIGHIDDVVIHGKTIVATNEQKAAKAVSELAFDITCSVIYEVFGNLLTMIYNM